MKSFRKALILFSLMATLAALAAAQSSPFQAASGTEQHAGCHAPAPKTPAPVSYQCCQAGHDSLLLVNAFSQHLSPLCATISDACSSFATQVFSTVLRIPVSPPGETAQAPPLRI